MRLSQNALYMLELNRRVPDLESRTQQIVNPPQNRIALRWRHVVNQHVAAQRARFRPQTPDMQIVHVDNAWQLAQLTGDLRQFQPLGQALQKNVERVADDPPTGPHNGYADQNRQNRI